MVPPYPPTPNTTFFFPEIMEQKNQLFSTLHICATTMCKDISSDIKYHLNYYPCLQSAFSHRCCVGGCRNWRVPKLNKMDLQLFPKRPIWRQKWINGANILPQVTNLPWQRAFATSGMGRGEPIGVNICTTTQQNSIVNNRISLTILFYCLLL